MMNKTCETCNYFLRETRKGGTCKIHHFALTNRGKPIVLSNGKPAPFYTYCSHKACSKYKEKEVDE